MAYFKQANPRSRRRQSEWLYAENPGGANLREALDFCIRRWQSITAAALLSAAAAAGIAVSIPPAFTSTAQILLEQPRASPIGVDPVASTLVYDSPFIDSQVSVLTSGELLTRVVHEAELLDDPYFVGEDDPSIVDRLREAVARVSLAVGLPAPAANAGVSAETDLSVRAVKRLRKLLRVSREGRSYVMTISVTSGNAEKSAMLANAVTQAYVADQLQARFHHATQASTWLADRLDALQDRLKQSEDAVEAFKIEHNLLSTRAGTLTEQQLSELNLQLISARADLAEKRAQFEQARKLLDSDGDIESIPQVLRSDVITALRARHSDVTRREAELVSRYGSRHPDVSKVRAERGDVESQISAEVERIVGNLANELQVAETRQVSLALSLDEVGGQSGTDNQVAIQLRELERVANANKTLYEGFLERANVVDEEKTFADSGVRIISRATIPEAASYPPKKVIVLFGLVLGIGIGTGGALARELMNPGFATATQAEQQLEIPILAAVPKIAASNLLPKPDGHASSALTQLSRQSPYNEAIRSLRHALFSEIEQDHAPVVQITSALPREGKTVTAISLAMSAAAAGYRVLVIDADFRQRGLTKHFGMTGKLGLVDVITNIPDNRQVVWFDDRTGIYILPAGSNTLNPSDLLGSPRMGTFLESARKSFDAVILDSTPICSIADAPELSRHVDSIAFMVKWSSTPRAAVTEALRRLNRAKIAGIAITMVDERQSGSYGSYHGY